MTSDAGAWDSGTIAPARPFSRTFASAGTFAYHFAIHPNMRATITVATGPTPAAGRRRD